MKLRTSYALMVFSCLCIGCQSQDFVARNAIKQTATINDILQQQVLDNVAIFAANRNAMPYFAIVGDGSAQVADSGSVSPTLMFNSVKFTGANLGMNASRGLQENWKLSPCMTAGRLARLRCAFQLVFGRPAIETADLPDGRSWVRVNEGCFRCIEEMVRVGILPTPVDGGSPLKPVDPAQEGGWIFKGHNEAATYVTKLEQGIDCAFPTGWFGVGHKHDVPKCACYSACACDAYVWVCPEGMDGFSRFTISVVALATIDPLPLPNYYPGAQPQKSPAALRHALSQFTNDAAADRQANPRSPLHTTMAPQFSVVDKALFSEQLNSPQLLEVRHVAETTIATLEQTGAPTAESRRLLDSARQLVFQIDDYLAPPRVELALPVPQPITPSALDRPGFMPFSKGGGIEFYPQPGL